MIPKRKFIVIIPFNDIIEDYSTYDHFLWFYDKGLKSVIETLVSNLTLTYGIPFNELKLNNILDELYGSTLSDNILEDHFAAIESLDRCNASNKELEVDNRVIEIFTKYLARDVGKHLSNIFSHDTVWEIDSDQKLLWKGDNLVLVVYS